MSDTPLTPAVFHILLALADGPLHGYAIMQRAEESRAGIAGHLRLPWQQSLGSDERGKPRHALRLGLERSFAGRLQCEHAPPVVATGAL